MNKFFLAALSCFVMMLGACSDKNTPEPQPNPDPEPKPEPGVEEVVPLKSIPFSKGLNLSDWFNVSEAYWFNPTFTPRMTSTSSRALASMWCACH